MASEEDNLRVFTPPPSVHGEPTEPVYGWAGRGSVNSGYVPSDGEMVYGYAKHSNGRAHKG